MNNEFFYRPPWTCGKYNAEKHVAIMFNLLSSSEYLFEAESADVVDYVLRAGKNGSVSVDTISSELDIAPRSIMQFFFSLIDCGLLTTTFVNSDCLKQYREQCAAIPYETSITGDKAGEYLQVDGSPVERAYSEAVRECTSVYSVMFELTYRCSEKCLHCYNPGATRNDDERCTRNQLVEMNIDEYRRIIDEMCDAGMVSATITGGDPFSHKDVWDILDYLYQKDVAVSILTNGLSLNSQIERIAALFPRDISLSIYSGDAKEHDYITRVEGSWERTVNIIAALRRQAIPVRINCVIMRPCIKSVLGVKALAKKYNCAVLFDVGVTDSIDGDVCATNNLRLTPEELEIILMDDDVAAKTEENELYTTPIPTNGTPCLAGVGNFCVTPDGWVIPCVAFRLKLGNLKNQSFISIVRENLSLQNWYNSKPTDYEECWTHEYCSYCNFCVGNNYREHGDISKASENNCYIAKARHKVAMMLKKGYVQTDDAIKKSIVELPEYTPCILHRQIKEMGK